MQLHRLITSYHNADAVDRFIVRCLLSALAFPAGLIFMAWMNR